jgi:hypothetical protein
MTNPNEKGFNPGGVKDRYDNRDYQWHEVGYGTMPFDWNTGFDIESKLGFKLKVKDQNGSYSCGGQAWSYLAEVLEALNTNTYEPRSAKYIYAQTYVPSGGSAGRDNSNIFCKQGVAEESKLPSYDSGQPPQEGFMRRSEDITYEIRNNAKLSMASSYAQIGTDIESFATAIRDNGGAIIGITGSNNGTWNSIAPFPPVPGADLWYHWIYCGKAKIISGKKHIGVFNSWGNAAGDNGWQWISEDYFKTLIYIFSGWTHVYNGNPPVAPFKHTFTKTLDYGMSDPEVQWLQKALTLEECFPDTISPTLFFGNVTKQSVQKFQVKYNIVSSGSSSTTGFGRVGPKTLAKLNSIYA